MTADQRMDVMSRLLTYNLAGEGCPGHTDAPSPAERLHPRVEREATR
jgi:hypothetical protein